MSENQLTFDILEVAQKAIIEEGNAVLGLAELIDDNFKKAIELISSNTNKLIVSGTGKSGIIGQKIAATLTSTGTPAFFLSPANALHGDLGYIQNGDLVILISKSGENDEFNSIIPYLKRNNNKIISIVSNKNSSLAQKSDVVLWIGNVKEICPNNLAPTTSTTLTTVLGDVIALILMKIKKFTDKDFAMYHPGGQLGKKLLLHVRDLMHINDEIPIVHSDTTIKDAILEISTKRLGFTVVSDADKNILGIITDGDLRRMLDKHIDIQKDTASKIMTLNPKTISMNKLAVNALAKMEKYKITSLIVVDKNDKLVGVLHIHDILKVGIK